MDEQEGLRRAVFWSVALAAGVVVVASVVETFTADPNEGEGWIGGPIQLVFAGGPLIAVAVGLRSRRRSVAKRTAIGALVFALAAALVLVMQLLDPGENAFDRLVSGAAVLVFLAAFAVEVGTLHRHGTPASRAAPE